MQPLFLHVVVYAFNLMRLCLQDSWEIIEGLKGNPGNIQEPEKQEGFLLKRRKWPMKGWHKVGTASLTSLPLTAVKFQVSILDFLHPLSSPSLHALEEKVIGYLQTFSSSELKDVWRGREESKRHLALFNP